MYEKGRRSGLCVGVLLLSLLVFSAGAEAKTYYVTQNGGGDKGGGDWNNALDEGGLRNKLKESENGDVFWVAKGIYRPSGEKDLNASFVLKEGVKLYGGFKGDETSLEARRPDANVTVLTGDLDGDDKRDGNGATPKAGDIVGENSYTVVRSSKCTAAAVLDGFTVCGGIGEKGKVENHAGGMHNIESSPTITRCVFSGNKAVRYMGSGAGMCNSNGSNPVISYCTFSGNMSEPVKCAGGMYNGSSSPTVTHCAFSGNIGYAGGMLNDGGNPVITQCNFSDNEAGPGRAHGGGMYNGRGKPLVSHCIFSRNKTSIQFSSGGGMHNAEKSEAVVTHCTFSENTALKGYGGGMFNMGTSRPTIAYCTFSENNVGDGSGGGMYNDDRSTPTVSCCVFSGNKAKGANAKGGGMFNHSQSEPTVVNCTFSGNSADKGSPNNKVTERPWGGLGGGMCNFERSKPKVINCTFFRNRGSVEGSPEGSGGGIYNALKSEPTMINCILWDNGTEIVNEKNVTLTPKNCVIQGWTEGGAGVTSADPKLGGLKDNGGPTLTHALPSDSIAVDAGTLEGLSANIRDLVSVDQRGYKRTDAKPDIGAYEFMQQPMPVPTKFAIELSWNAGGSVKHKGAAVASPFKTEVASGDSVAFDITANPGFVIGTLTDNGTDVRDAAGKVSYRYALNNVTAAHTLSVTFRASAPVAPTKFAVQVSWNAGGSVKHKGAAVTSPFKTEVTSGDSVAFDITANPGFVIGTLTNNGTDVRDAAGKVSYRYALNNVTAAHTLSVTFKASASVVPTKFDVQVSWNAGGSVKHKGAAVTSPFKTEVTSGDSVEFDITANPSFVIGTLADNGIDVRDAAGKSGYRYALDNVTAAHALSVSFKASASNPPASSDPKPNEPQKPDPKKPAPSPAPNQPLPPESSDVPLPDIPISPERWVAEVVPESGKPGTLRFTLTTSFESQQSIASLESKMRDIVEGTLRTELSLGGQKASLTFAVDNAVLGGSLRRYGLKLTGNVLEGNLSNTAITALQYRLEGDSKIHSVSLPEAGIPISKMQRNQSPQQNKSSSSGGCETGLGSLALVALSAFAIRRRR